MKALHFNNSVEKISFSWEGSTAIMTINNLCHPVKTFKVGELYQVENLLVLQF